MQRKLARENAFILVFESVCKKDESSEEIFEKAVSVRELEYDDYVKDVFFGSQEHATEIDAVTEKHLKGWRSDRISPVSRAVIRLATYEIMFLSDIPARVSINEAIELAKKYDDEKSYSFVNGVLNAVAEELGKK
jgi:N utilization substance protein B